MKEQYSEDISSQKPTRCGTMRCVGREHPRHRLPARNYVGRRAYFLTLCTADRQEHFSSTEITKSLIEVMHEQFRKRDLVVYAYCFMPDHCHVLLVSRSETCELAVAVRAYKGVAVAIARKFGIHDLWQPNFYEHILRSSEELNAVAAYILQNPSRGGLIGDWRDWPFSGCVMADWKTRKSVEPYTPCWK